MLDFSDEQVVGGNSKDADSDAALEKSRFDELMGFSTVRLGRLL